MKFQNQKMSRRNLGYVKNAFGLTLHHAFMMINDNNDALTNHFQTS